MRQKVAGESEHQMSIPEKEYIGSVYTDVASLLIADPCKVLPSKGDKRKWPTYEDLIRKWQESDPPMWTEAEILQGATRRMKRVSPIVKLLDDAAVVRFGTDGHCHVYVERNGDGSIERIIIETGMVTKGPISKASAK